MQSCDPTKAPISEKGANVATCVEAADTFIQLVLRVRCYDYTANMPFFIRFSKLKKRPHKNEITLETVEERFLLIQAPIINVKKQASPPYRNSRIYSHALPVNLGKPRIESRFGYMQVKFRHHELFPISYEPAELSYYKKEDRYRVTFKHAETGKDEMVGYFEGSKEIE